MPSVRIPTSWGDTEPVGGHRHTAGVSASPEQHVLERMLGAGATFRSGQLEAIRAIATDRRRALVVQRTGWGKCAVYFIATRLLRDRGAGPTLLVSPLLALMRNQIRMAERIGIRAETINSSNREEWDGSTQDSHDDAVDLLLVSPERFANPGFRDDVLPARHGRVGPARDRRGALHQRLGTRLPARLPPARSGARPPAATVCRCLHHRHGERPGGRRHRRAARRDLAVLRGPLERESLALSVVDLPSAAERMAWLATVIPALDGSGIVYALTIADTTGWPGSCGPEGSRPRRTAARPPPRSDRRWRRRSWRTS